MTNRVLIPFGDEWLVMSPDEFQKALQKGSELMPDTLQTESVCGPQWLSVKQMAEATNMGSTYWAEEARSGRCPSRRFGTAVRIPASYLRSLECKSTGHSGNGFVST